MAMDVVDYDIRGEEMQYVEVELDPGEAAVGEAGSMMFMDAAIKMETVFGDGRSGGGGFLGKLLGAGKRLVTGESLFTTVYTNSGQGKQRVAFAAPYPGKILAMNLKQMGGLLICQRDSFLCAARGVSLGIAFQKKIATGFFGGEGFIMQKLEGDGLAFVHAGGCIVKRELQAGQTLMVDTGCIVAYTQTVDFDIQYVGNVKTALFGGEGLFFARVTGPGTVWLQSLPFSRLASRVFAAAPQNGGRREEGALGGLMDAGAFWAAFWVAMTMLERRAVLVAGGAVFMASAQVAAQPNPAPTPRRHPILVLNSLDADVSVIDPITHKVTKRVPTGKEPHHLYLTPDEKSVIVANAGGNSLTFMDPATGDVQRVIRNIADPYHLRFSPDMRWFVTAANRLNHVDIYHWQPAQDPPLRLAKRLPTGKVPSHLAIDSKSSVVYVSVQESDQIMAIELATQTPRWTQAVGRMPADLYLAADDRTLLLGLTGDRVVQVWDVGGAAPKLAKTIPTGNGAHAFRALGDKRHVFVSNRVANTISLIDVQSLSVVAELPAPGGPDCMEVLADGRTLLVASRWARKLTVIDIASRQVLRQVDVGRSPHGVWTLSHAPRL